MFSGEWSQKGERRGTLFKSYKWPRQNFSSQNQYNIKQTSDENKEKYQLGDY